MARGVLVAVLIVSACSGSASSTRSLTTAVYPTTSTTIATATRPDEVGADVHVAVDGDDAASGTDREPVRTLERALELVPVGGTIELSSGTHLRGHVFEAVEHVTIRGATGAVLDGGDTQAFGIFCDGCRAVTIEHLEVKGFTDIGIGFTRSTDIVLRDLLIHGNGVDVAYVDWELEGYGIHVDSSVGVTISGNDVFDNGPEQTRTPVALLGTGINTYGNRDVRIVRNHAHANRGAGIVVEDSFEVVVADNLVEGNDLDATIDGWWDGALWVDGGGDVEVLGNVFRHNAGPGIQISDEDDQSPGGYVLIGNVSTGNTFGIFIWGFGTDGFPPPETLRLVGNDFTGNLELDVWIEPDL